MAFMPKLLISDCKVRAFPFKVSVTPAKPDNKLLLTPAKPLHKPVYKELRPDLISLISKP